MGPQHLVWQIKNTFFALVLIVALAALVFSFAGFETASYAQAEPTSTQLPNNPYFSSNIVMLEDGLLIDEDIINGPPQPPAEYERPVAFQSEYSSIENVVTLNVPVFDWFFGCSATSGAMIAAYYDRNGYENMYTGPTNDGVMPLDGSSWPAWTDGDGDTYNQCPLIASRSGLDGRSTRGSIDDYWIAYESTAQDPFIANGWVEHAWGDAIGDFMKTSQSNYGNVDGSTIFYNWGFRPGQLTCDDMVTEGITQDGTYGRKLFYEAKGYTVTDCYNQKTDNNGGGFTFNMFMAEIDAGRPVMINLEGHTVVGVGYDDATNTVYIHDTWDYFTHTFTWGSSYSGMPLRSVSIVNLVPPDHQMYNVPLVTGWNLVSFNVHPADTTPATVLSGITGNYDLVYAWDASGAHAGSGNWMKYDPTVPPFVNTLGSLDERIGFWIHMTAPDTLEVTGNALTTTEIDLSVNAGGWNLVGYPSGVNRTLPDSLSENGVGTDFSLVYAYHASDTGDPWKLFDRTVPVFVNDLKELTPGWGYWIMVSADHTWSVDNYSG